MLEIDKDAVICDLAETYGIYDMRSLPARTVATLAVGLRNDSRIKMKLAGLPVTIDQILTIKLYDIMNWIAWTKTEDAQKGRGMPIPLLKRVLAADEEKELSFCSAEEFEKAREELLRNM